MAGSDARRGVGDEIQGRLAVNENSRVIYITMLACPVMTGEAAGGIDAGCNDVFYVYA